MCHLMYAHAYQTGSGSLLQSDNFWHTIWVNKLFISFSFQDTTFFFLFFTYLNSFQFNSILCALEDGTDGKQARRTKSSTPLGELFDHGLDSWATLFLPVALFSVFGRSGDFGMSVTRMYWVLWLILGSFIISHWEKYNTGVLFLPWSYDLSQNV